MLSNLKATSPAPANSTNPTTTIARRLKQNARRDLNMTVLLGWRRRQHAAQKYGAVGYDQFSAPPTAKYLNPIVSSQIRFDHSLLKMVAVGGHPGCHDAVGFAHHS